MFKYIKEYRFYITLFVFILIPILAIDTSTRSPRNYRFYDNAIVFITSPIQYGIKWSLDKLVFGINRYAFLLNSQKVNESLNVENQKLLNTIFNLKEAQIENERLRKLLNFKEKYQLDTVPARIIAKDISSQYRAIRINKGKNSGITENMAVIHSSGVVGKVFRVTEKTADIITILDLLSGVDTIVKRSRVRGIVEGLTNSLCQLKFTRRTDDIKHNDFLITSGLGGLFPKGVSVGKVQSVEKKSYGITQSISVKPSVNFSNIEEVLVVTRHQQVPMHTSDQMKIKFPNITIQEGILE